MSFDARKLIERCTVDQISHDFIAVNALAGPFLVIMCQIV